MIKKTSLARDFTIFSVAILLSVLVVCLVVGLFAHYSYYKKQDSRIVYEAKILDDALFDSLDFTVHYINFLGNRIATAENPNAKYIVDLFSAISYRDKDGKPVWDVFSWITPNKNIIASSIEGELESEIDISKRQYLDLASTHPGQLIFSPIGLGSLSKQSILPAGLGIVGNNNKFLGTIGVGFNLERLENELQRVLDHEELVFMLFDNNLNFILSSADISHSDLNFFTSEDVTKKLASEIVGDSGVLSTPIKNNKFSFSYFKHVNKYPFYFIIGENIKIVSDKYWQLVFPRIAELCIMGILFIVLLYYFRKQIVKPIITLAESAKKIAGGDNKVKVYYGQYEEVNFLADQLKEIQHAKELLALSKTDVESLNISLENKIRARTIDLERALTIKTDFLNSMSHEVRTPVHGITSISKGLVEHWSEYSEEKRFILATAVAANSQRLFSLVSNILDLSTFNAGAMYFNLSNQDLILLIKDVISE